MVVYKGRAFKDIEITQEEFNTILLDKLLDSTNKEVIELFKGLIYDIAKAQLKKDEELEEYNTNKLYFFITFYKEYAFLIKNSEEVLNYIDSLEKSLELKSKVYESMKRSVENYEEK